MPETRDPLKAKAGRVDLLTIPERLAIAIDGIGAPGGETFQQAIGALYSVAYTAKFAAKARGLESPKVQPLEALWTMGDPKGGSLPPPEEWSWTLLIPQPSPIDRDLLTDAIATAQKKKPNPALERIAITTLPATSVAQTLHIGPYAEEPATVAMLMAAIAEQGHAAAGPMTEVYLSDPNRTAPEKLKTIIRFPVRAAG